MSDAQLNTEKPHPPSERRLRQVRKRGESIRSPLLSGSCATFGLLLVAFGLLFSYLAGFCLKNEMLLDWLGNAGFADLELLFRGSLRVIAFFVAVPMATAAIIGGIVDRIIASGVWFEFSTLSPRLSRLSLAQGFHRIFSGLKKSWLAVLKVMSIGVILAGFFFWFLLILPELVFLPDQIKLERLLFTVSCFLLGGVTTLFLLGVTEYAVNRREFLRRHSMSREELRREQREENGDPHIRALQRELREQALYADLKERVRRARVVIIKRK